MTRDKETVARELLAVRCRRGDRTALEELVRLWERRLLYFIRRIVRDDADSWDVLQKTWIKVLSGIGSLHDPKSLAPWLYRVSRNTALTYARLKPPACEPLGDDPVARNGHAADVQLRFENAEQVNRGLSTLSLAHREVLTLFFLDDLSTEEVATVLGVPSGTVRSRLHYAKIALRNVLEKESCHE